ncbi:MAG: HAD-IA family hydrolase [Pelagibacteraceae bacterium]|jgi:phosphoglycolate phosphatase|nr:HAD-IA family hydrolase [Pelagibacteraceae bacterium]MCI5079359.1 HAD-IA family hydrolase [Pelagibacteraceae bacterium]
MKNCLVFDLDGTLVDTAPDLMAAHNHVMKKYGYEEKPINSIRKIAGRGAASMLIESIDSQGNLIKKKPIDSETHRQMTNDFISFYRENLSGNSKIRKNATSLLDWCKEKDIICAVCTNKREDLAIKLLKEINLYKYFDYVAGADTFDYRKPDPRHLTDILDILDIDKKNSIMLGDSETDANTAKAARVHFVLINDGYTEKKLEDIHHDHLIEDFEAVKQIASNYLTI